VVRLEDLSGARSRGSQGRSPEVVSIVNSAFSAAFAELGLSDGDEAVALRVARRIIELAFAAERDTERLKATPLA
jgi:hypothetical protein